MTSEPQIVTQTLHDTIYQASQKYDSIYVSDSLIERYHPSAFHYDTLVQALIRTDTIFREKQKMEYRYKFLRDTTYIHRVDTIPKLVTVEKTVHERYIPPWIKYLAIVGAIALLTLAIYLFCKLRP